MAHNQMEVLKMNKAKMEIEVDKDKTVVDNPHSVCLPLSLSK